MTLHLVLVLAAYALCRGLEYWLTYLNVQHLALYGDQVPPGFEGRIDAADLARMRDYTVERNRFQMAASLVTMLAMIAFFFGGLANTYNSWVSSLALSWPLPGLVFFLLLFYGETLLFKVPLNLYHTFVTEKRFGFNQQGLGGWLLDTVKGLLLGSLVYGLALLAGFWLIHADPGSWWLWVWGVLVAIALLLLYASPYLIEPLFNRFTPLADQELATRIDNLMARAGLAVSQVLTMDASRRSSHSNAYFSGLGKSKRIVLFDTLLARLNQDELLAVLAHEAGHWRKHHLLKRLAAVALVALAGCYGLFSLVQDDFLVRLFNLSQPTLYAKLLLAGFLVSLTLFPCRPLLNWLSRRQEEEADRFAVALTGHPRDLARALVVLGRDNLTNLHPHPWYAAFFFSHPPLAQRVRQLLSAG